MFFPAHTLAQLQHGASPTEDSLSWTSPTWIFSMSCSPSWTAPMQVPFKWWSFRDREISGLVPGALLSFTECCQCIAIPLTFAHSSLPSFFTLYMFSQGATNIPDDLSLGKWCVQLGASRNWLCPSWQKLIASSHRSLSCSTPHHTLPNPCHINPVQLDSCAGILSHNTKVKEFLHIGPNTLQEVAAQKWMQRQLRKSVTTWHLQDDWGIRPSQHGLRRGRINNP